MSSGFTEEQDALREAVARLVERTGGTAKARAATDSGTRDTALWSTLCEQIGVGGLALPESAGGAGAGLREVQIVAEELGRSLSPVPFLGSVLAGRLALAAGADEPLTEIAEGGIVAVAWTGVDGGWDPQRPAVSATASGDGYTVDGRAHYVLDGADADSFLVPATAGTEVLLLRVVAEATGVSRVDTPGMDRTRRLATVEFSGARATVLGAGDARAALTTARDETCAVLAAEQAGAAARALESTVAYTVERKQFGRPIGGFQALKHRMADLFVLVETARSAAYATTAPGADLPRLAAVAKAYCSEALQAVTGEMIQLHGGIGITWEHDAHMYFKRAHATAQLFGQPHEHLARFGALVGTR